MPYMANARHLVAAARQRKSQHGLQRTGGQPLPQTIKYITRGDASVNAGIPNVAEKVSVHCRTVWKMVHKDDNGAEEVAFAKKRKLVYGLKTHRKRMKVR